MIQLSKEELLRTKVSFYRHMTSHEPILMTIERVFNGIRSDFFKEAVTKVRDYKSKGLFEAASKVKSSLQAVTFCGVFEGRRSSNLCSVYNNLMIIDIDHLEDNEIERVGNCLRDDEYVIAYWKSPSGDGWKGIVGLEYNTLQSFDTVTKHRHAFISVKEYLKDKYDIELDESGKDISRLCYMTWYPELVVKDFSSRFVVNLESELNGRKKSSTQKTRLKDITPAAINWNKLDGEMYYFVEENKNRTTIDKIYRFLKKRGASITSSYKEWVKVAFSIASSFHPVYGRRMFMKLCELDGPNHNADESEKLIYDAYSKNDGRCDFGTILYLASKKGFTLI